MQEKSCFCKFCCCLVSIFIAMNTNERDMSGSEWFINWLAEMVSFFGNFSLILCGVCFVYILQMIEMSISFFLNCSVVSCHFFNICWSLVHSVVDPHGICEIYHSWSTSSAVAKERNH